MHLFLFYPRHPQKRLCAGHRLRFDIELKNSIPAKRAVCQYPVFNTPAAGGCGAIQTEYSIIGQHKGRHRGKAGRPALLRHHAAECQEVAESKSRPQEAKKASCGRRTGAGRAAKSAARSKKGILRPIVRGRLLLKVGRRKLKRYPAAECQEAAVARSRPQEVKKASCGRRTGAGRAAKSAAGS